MVRGIQITSINEHGYRTAHYIGTPIEFTVDMTGGSFIVTAKEIEKYIKMRNSMKVLVLNTRSKNETE